jgi:hypothetical protein
MRDRWMVILVCVLAPTLPAGAEVDAVEEWRLKAAFVLNFARFIHWPPDRADGRAEFVFGVVGKTPVGEALQELVRGKTWNGRPMVVRLEVPPAEMSQCEVVYLADSEQQRLEAHLQRLESQPVLTVSDMPGFAGRGGMIELFMEGNRVRFAVAVRAMRAAGLAPSSKLLALARLIGD